MWHIAESSVTVYMHLCVNALPYLFPGRGGSGLRGRGEERGRKGTRWRKRKGKGRRTGDGRKKRSGRREGGGRRGVEGYHEDVCRGDRNGGVRVWQVKPGEGEGEEVESKKLKTT